MRLLEFFRPYQVVCTRRISEEEQLTVQVFRSTADGAQADMERFLGVFRDHKKAFNQNVVRAATEQLAALDTAIKTRSDEVARLDGELEKARAECRKFDEILAGKRRRVEALQPQPSAGNGRA